MAIGQKFGQSVATEMQGRIIEELRKRWPQDLTLLT